MTVTEERRTMEGTNGVAPVGVMADAVETDAARLFAGPGEMRARCGAFAWAATPLGPVEQWSHSLRTAVDILLGCHNPMFLWWGPQLVQIYNDAYRPSLGQGDRHPRALGALGAAFWTDIWEAIGPQIAQVFTTGEPTWHEDQYLPIERNGRLEDVWWTYGYSPVHDDDGRIGGVLVVCQETTAGVRARAERERLLAEAEAERARATGILEAMADAYFALDADFRIVAVNAAMERFTGLARGAMLGGVFWDVFPATVGTDYERHYRAAAAEGATAHFTDAYDDGRLALTSEADVYPVAGGGVAVFWRDVTARVRADAERERLLRDSEQLRVEAEVARVAAEAANRAKGEFLAIMSHELRTPLNAIGGYAELLEMGIRGSVTPEQRHDIARIQSSQRHLLGLINEVLNYAKLETGSVVYDLTEVPVAEALAAAEVLIAPQARAKRLMLAVSACPRAVAVRADAEKLRQILVNLLSNAVKFTDAGGRVELSCDHADDCIRIRLHDTGIGIAADKLASIFDPFVQVRADLTRTAEGTGLGLAISRDLARGMGGELTVESTPGVGSTFTLTLPAAP